MLPGDKSWSCSIGRSWTMGFCTFSVSKLFPHTSKMTVKASTRFSTGLTVHPALMNVTCELAFWTDFTLSPLVYSLSYFLSDKSFYYLYMSLQLLNVAFISGTPERLLKGAQAQQENSPASPVSCFIWLLLSRPVFPCEAAQLVVLMGLLKPVPRYPLSQHWALSQSTARKNLWQEEKKKRDNFFFVLLHYECFFPHPLVLLIPVLKMKTNQGWRWASAQKLKNKDLCTCWALFYKQLTRTFLPFSYRSLKNTQKFLRNPLFRANF